MNNRTEVPESDLARLAGDHDADGAAAGDRESEQAQSTTGDFNDGVKSREYGPPHTPRSEGPMELGKRIAIRFVIANLALGALAATSHSLSSFALFAGVVIGQAGLIGVGAALLDWPLVDRLLAAAAALFALCICVAVTLGEPTFVILIAMFVGTPCAAVWLIFAILRLHRSTLHIGRGDCRICAATWRFGRFSILQAMAFITLFAVLFVAYRLVAQLTRSAVDVTVFALALGALSAFFVACAVAALGAQRPYVATAWVVTVVLAGAIAVPLAFLPVHRSFEPHVGIQTFFAAAAAPFALTLLAFRREGYRLVEPAWTRESLMRM